MLEHHAYFNSSETRNEVCSHESLGLMPNDIAYMVSESGLVKEVRIIGGCAGEYGHVGHGYKAESTSGNGGRSVIHTCNAFLSPSLKKAQKAALEMRKGVLKELYKEIQYKQRHYNTIKKAYKKGLKEVMLWKLDGTVEKGGKVTFPPKKKK